jgi:hypothetical protein
MKGLVLVEHVDRELDVICLARMLLTPCRSLTRMYGPAVRCKRFSSIWRQRSCINVSGL